ncbi:hypothetical protein JHK82_021874 [Glycine max]|nr:hypothetical protein JHK85_022337 [Glycine max]KAG5025977.1 hypothetical protein JHK86_021891 [Glycine max]KAG5137143.1 hypothetical protein JHK82_021874 [Glycine max]
MEDLSLMGYPRYIVLKTATTTENASDNLEFSYQLISSGAITFYVYMYFAEIEKLLTNQTREFDVYVNGGLLQKNASVPFLGHGTLINIGGNKLSGSIPATLSERTRNGSLLILSVDSKKQEFSYSEVQSITNNFERIVGKGGFGTVYYGCIGETQVAVKMLSPSTQGYQQFLTEAKILTRVHHRCLTPLIGYCNEGTGTALIYEYMTNGDLAEQLSGLEYLHNGCKPPIVHRDVKTRNILLNENRHGKISDFGLSRIFSEKVTPMYQQ